MYITLAEASALISTYLASGDERRTVWEAASEADQTVALDRAHRVIDGCYWRGMVVSEAQSGMWPRMHNRTEISILPTGEGTPPASLEAADWTYTGIPIEIRIGTAIQAAAEAVRGEAHDMTRQMAEAAHRGVMSSSGRAGATSTNLTRANMSVAALDYDALVIVRGLLAGSAGLR